MRPSRTWRAIYGGSRRVRFADSKRLLLTFGYVLDRLTASHRLWLLGSSPTRTGAQFVDLTPNAFGCCEQTSPF